MAAPAAAVAGTVLTASSIVEMSPWLKWSLAIIAGGGIAGTIHVFTGATRLTSTATTGGLANPAVSTTEAGGALGVSILAIAAPILGVLFRAPARLRRGPSARSPASTALALRPGPVRGDVGTALLGHARAEADEGRMRGDLPGDEGFSLTKRRRALERARWNEGEDVADEAEIRERVHPHHQEVVALAENVLVAVCGRCVETSR